MHRFAATTAAAAALLTIVGAALPAGSQEAVVPVAYTTVATSQAGCELANVNLGTGELTDLPAEASPDACVADLAVAPDGTVWGLLGVSVFDAAALPAAPVEGVYLVRFDASGVPTATQITDGDALFFLAAGGLAVDAGGTVYVQMTVVLPRAPVAGVFAPQAGSLADCYGTLCLFEVDPTTAAASVIGPSGLLSSVFDDLAVCGPTMWTLGYPDGLAMQEVDPTTGATDPSGAYIADATPVGYDCATDSTTMYALSADQPKGVTAEGAGTQGVVGVLDPVTGEFTQTAPLSDPNAFVDALAVAPAQAPLTPTTTTTTATPTTTTGAAAAAVVTPRFTG